MQPVVPTLFSRWQQQCSLMLSVLHHFVSVIIIGLREVMNVNDHYAICVVFDDNFESIHGVLYDSMIASIMMNGLLCYQVVVFLQFVCLTVGLVRQLRMNSMRCLESVGLETRKSRSGAQFTKYFMICHKIILSQVNIQQWFKTW